jgi:hypothetical protein
MRTERLCIRLICYGRSNRWTALNSCWSDLVQSDRTSIISTPSASPKATSGSDQRSPSSIAVAPISPPPTILLSFFPYFYKSFVYATSLLDGELRSSTVKNICIISTLSFSLLLFPCRSSQSIPISNLLTVRKTRYLRGRS